MAAAERPDAAPPAGAFNQSISQSISQSVNQSIKQASKQAIKRPDQRRLPGRSINQCGGRDECSGRVGRVAG